MAITSKGDQTIRVSVDIDTSEFLMLKAYYGMRFRYSQDPKIWRTQYGGLHLIARDLPLSWFEANFERRLFQDDESRVWLDIACQGKPQQILFGEKDGVERIEMDERRLIFAEPWWRARAVRKPWNGNARRTRQ